MVVSSSALRHSGRHLSLDPIGEGGDLGLEVVDVGERGACEEGMVIAEVTDQRLPQI